jgi:hypothetical protein
MKTPAARTLSTDNYTTPDDANVFWGYLDEWQVKLGLSDWRIDKSPKPSRYLAEMTNWDWGQRKVTCRFGNNWRKTQITKANLEQTAVHELLHVLLHELISASKYGGSSDVDLESVEHAVVNRLERLLVPKGGI